MSEEDFVFAWILATRASSGGATWTYAKTQHLIDNAKQTYKQIKESCNEADSRTED